jgi:hypothetical protein
MSKSILYAADPASGLAFERHLFARLWDATIETVPYSTADTACGTSTRSFARLPLRAHRS